MRHHARRLGTCLLAAALAGGLLGCSVKKLAVNQVGNALASGSSVFETDDDLELIGGALPFSIKLVESLLAESPDHPGLRLTACRSLVVYTYGWVHHDAEVVADEDVERARALRARAGRLYLRAFDDGMHALELHHAGLRAELARSPRAAAARVRATAKGQEVPLLYWSAAALGLAVSVSKNDPAMLARLPEVEALLDRALEIDEGWDMGALHDFAMTIASIRPGRRPEGEVRAHYERALALSRGLRASSHVAHAEAVAVPSQDRALFVDLLNEALAIDVDADRRLRLANVMAQRRARWLLGRVDELFLDEGGGGRP